MKYKSLTGTYLRSSMMITSLGPDDVFWSSNWADTEKIKLAFLVSTFWLLTGRWQENLVDHPKKKIKKEIVYTHTHHESRCRCSLGEGASANITPFTS